MGNCSLHCCSNDEAMVQANQRLKDQVKNDEMDQILNSQKSVDQKVKLNQETDQQQEEAKQVINQYKSDEEKIVKIQAAIRGKQIREELKNNKSNTADEVALTERKNNEENQAQAPQNSEQENKSLKGSIVLPEILNEQDLIKIKSTMNNAAPINLGVIRMADDAFYEGEWMKGMRWGKGEQKWADGGLKIKRMGLDDFFMLMEIYMRVSGKMIKQMVMVFTLIQKKQSMKESGQMINSMEREKKHGPMAQHMKVNCDYKNGKKCGKGKIKFADGSFYEGEFLQNNIQGTGKYIWPDGKYFEGTWEDNKMHGKGKIVWPDGRSYDGEYQYDLKHGHGTFEWSDGRKYTGNWKQGRQHGEGHYMTPNGEQRKGEWKEGKRVRWID